MPSVLECPQAEQPVQTESAPLPQPKKSVAIPCLLTGGQVLQLAAWFGLLTGLIECLTLAARRFLGGELIFFGDSVFYAAPLVQATVAVVLCLPLALFAVRRRECSEQLVVSVLAFLATFNTALLIPNLHYLAELMLALGVAAQAGRWVEKHPGKLLSGIPSSLKMLSIVVGLIFVAFGVLPAVQERRTLAQLPAAEANSPNVLLLVLDTVPHDALDLTSPAAESRTPNLRRLAAEGFVFQQAHSTCPWTLPSHASMLTSRLPHELSSSWFTGMSDKFPTIAEWLGERGYRTGGFVGNTIYCSSETGLDRGFAHYEDYVLSPAQLLLSTAWGRYLANETFLPLRLGCYDNLARRRAPGIRQNLTHWLDDTAGEHPYFVMVNLFDAHDPYAAPREFQRRAPTNLQERSELRFWWLADKQQLTAEQVDTQRTAYEDCIAHLDDEVGKLFEQLRQRGDLENTVVIVTADHGEHLGDHGLYGHGNSLYEASIHVPLIVWRSDLPSRGQRSDQIVSTRDLPATFAELAAPGDSHPFLGKSLLGYLDGEATDNADAAPVFSQIAAPSRWPACGGKSPVFRGPMKSVIAGGLKYIRNGDAVEEVYDVLTDPHELEDLSESLPAATLEELRALVKQQIAG